ncbi:MAG: DUF1735 and LamG domain-containing protein [Prevotellaceae bacterium]|jgi:hypothetical protein|nr:DUF1735 and LamG domain-containing protein [Prevotellaceae bacterium]
MKRIQLLFTGMATMVACLFAGCKDAEYGVTDNQLYLADAAASLAREKTVGVGVDGADLPIVVRLAKPASYDVQAEVRIDESLLKAYNTANKTSYVLLPSKYCTLPEKAAVTIKAQEVSGVLNLHINKLDITEEKYALPITVRSLSGDMSTSASRAQFVFLIDKQMIFDDEPLVAVTPNFRYANMGTPLKARPIAGWNLSLKAYTLEFWAKLDYYNTQNFALFSIYGNDSSVPDNYEFYFRFGDGNSQAGNPNGSRCYINWKAWGLNITGEYDLVANEWNHWACAYDGSNLILYRNGEIYRRVPCKYAGLDWVMHTFEMINSHQVTNNILNMAEIRLWKKALTSEQIKAGMRYAIEPVQPDLEAYWKMNEGDSFNDLFIDATGNGHDIEVDVTRLLDFGWTEPQNFGN